MLFYVNLIAVLLGLWALVDCVTRQTAAFPAYNKLTKPAWIGITALAVVVLWFSSMFSFLGIPALAASVVYLVDVRPAVSGAGTDRW